jgi:uncharacterized protein
MQWMFSYALGMELALLCGLSGLGASSGWWVTVLLAPLLEEVVMRWGVQEGLLRWGLRPGWAGAVSALVFALAHGLSRSWWLALGVLVPGWLLGWLYQRFGRLWVCVLAHVVMNVVWVTGWPGHLFFMMV